MIGAAVCARVARLWGMSGSETHSFSHRRRSWILSTSCRWDMFTSVRWTRQTHMADIVRPTSARPHLVLGDIAPSISP